MGEVEGMSVGAKSGGWWEGLPRGLGAEWQHMSGGQEFTGVAN